MNMRRDTLIQLVALALMVVFLSASAILTGEVSASMGRNRLVYSDSAEDGEPKEVALGIAMGAFRGVFVNYLWIRANELKEEGRYYEAVDLAKTITRLQPRFPKVWAFHAWNLAYNISVTTQTPEERWAWVESGIRLLRNQGIPANNNDLILHKELAWIYLHKVQGFMDDAHRYYKHQVAREWTIVLGAPPVRPLGADTVQSARQLYVDKWLRPVADAPDTIEQVYAAQPLARELVQRLEREAEASLDMGFLERFEMVSSLARTAIQMNRGSDKPLVSVQTGDPIAEIVLDPKYLDAGKLLLRHVRRRVLIDEYHMEPERMIRFTLKFGPLDWRHAAAHSLYWSARGVEEAVLRIGEVNRSDFDFVNTDRIVIHSVQELFRSGLLFYDIANPLLYLTTPDAAFLDTYSDYREEALTRAGVFGDRKRGQSEFANGQENFLRDAIRFLYRRGDKQRAEDYYRKLRTAPWLNIHNSELIHELSLPLDEFVVHEITDGDRITSPSVAAQEIKGALTAAFLEGLLGGNTPVFEGNVAYARMFHQEYQSTQSFRVWLAGQDGRMGFPPFDILAAQVLASLVLSVNVPQGPLMYQAAPPELRARTYVLLSMSQAKPAMDQMAQQGSPEFDSWFPPPPSTDGARQEMLAYIQQGSSNGRTELK